MDTGQAAPVPTYSFSSLYPPGNGPADTYNNFNTDNIRSPSPSLDQPLPTNNHYSPSLERQGLSGTGDISNFDDDDDLDVLMHQANQRELEEQARSANTVTSSSRSVSVDPSLLDDDLVRAAPGMNRDLDTARKRRRSESNFSLDDDELDEGVRRKRARDMVGIIKNSIVLSTQSQNLLDIVASNSNQFGLYFQTALLLSSRDMLLAMEESWETPKELQINVKQYGWAFLLGPHLPIYRDINRRLLKVLRKADIKHVPSDSDRGRTHILSSTITREVTLIRSAIKSAIVKSLSGDVTPAATGSSNTGRAKSTEAAGRDIASVVHFIARNTDVKITVHHYIRVAFLRWCAKKHEKNLKKNDSEKDDYWGAVDGELAGIRKKMPASDAQGKLFTEIYNRDLVAYGQPSLVGFQLHSTNEVGKWQSLCEAGGKEL